MRQPLTSGCALNRCCLCRDARDARDKRKNAPNGTGPRDSQRHDNGQHLKMCQQRALHGAVLCFPESLGLHSQCNHYRKKNDGQKNSENNDCCRTFRSSCTFFTSSTFDRSKVGCACGTTQICTDVTVTSSTRGDVVIKSWIVHHSSF